MLSVLSFLNGIFDVYMYTDIKVCVGGVWCLLRWYCLLLNVSPVDMSSSARWLFPSGAILSGYILHETEDHLWLGALLCDLGRLFSLSLVTGFSSLSSEGCCRGNEMVAV